MTRVSEGHLIRDLLAKANATAGTDARAGSDVQQAARVRQGAGVQRPAGGGWGADGAAGVLLGAGDDAAVLRGERLVVSTDLTVEDVHFRRSWLTFAEVGARAVTAAASDLAAMAADPVAVLLSLAVAPAEAEAVLSELGDGIQTALSRIDAPLVGGDLSASPGPVVIDVTVVGEAEQPVTRGGALPGDEVWVTGVLGGSAGAVHAWRAGSEPSAPLRAAFVQPTARIEEARWLTEQVEVRAMIDLSDGLVRDAGHLAEASDVGIVIDARLVPVHPGLAPDDGRSVAISGGEDYELCFVSPPDATDARTDAFRERFGIELTRVGHVEQGTGVEVVDDDGRERVTGGYDHFSVLELPC